MGSKPVIAELVGGISDRQKLWTYLRASVATGHAAGITNPPLTIGGAAVACGLNTRSVRRYFAAWERGGFLGRAYTKAGRVGESIVYMLVRDNGVEAPMTGEDGQEMTIGKAEQALWDAATTLDTFDIEFLANVAGTTVYAARTYLRSLMSCGYVEPVLPLSYQARDRLFRVSYPHRSKPLAPVVATGVYDPNEGRIVLAKKVRRCLAKGDGR